MGVYIRKDSPYWWLWLERENQSPLRRPTKIPHSPTLPQQKAENKRLAEIAYSAAMTALARGDLGIEPHAGPKLSVFWSKRYLPWLKTNYPKAVKETTRVIDTLFLPDFGDLTLDQIQKGRIHAWLETRAGVTPQSRQRELSHLRGLLTRAVEWDVIAAHPLADLELDAAPTKEIVRYLSPEEETRLLAALVARDDEERAARARTNEWRLARKKAPLPDLGTYADALHPVVILSLDTGMRRGEVFQARWSAIDWQAKMITVEWWTTKRNRTREVKSRRIPLSQRAISALTTWKDQQDEPKRAALIFPGRKPDQPLTNLQTSWEGVLTDAAIEEFRWHDLRHTFASKLVQRGVSLYKVQKWMGHASINQTMRYAHLAPDQGHAEVEMLSQL